MPNRDRLELEELIAELESMKGGTGFGEQTFMPRPEEEEENPIVKLLRGQSLEPYALDPSMGDQRLRVPRSYGPGGGGVFFTGGSPFPVDKKDQRTLAQGAMAATIMDVLSGRKARSTAGQSGGGLGDILRGRRSDPRSAEPTMPAQEYDARLDVLDPEVTTAPSSFRRAFPEVEQDFESTPDPGSYVETDNELMQSNQLDPLELEIMARMLAGRTDRMGR